MAEKLPDGLFDILYKQQVVQLKMMSCFIELTKHIPQGEPRQPMVDRLQALLEAMEDQTKAFKAHVPPGQNGDANAT